MASMVTIRGKDGEVMVVLPRWMSTGALVVAGDGFEVVDHERVAGDVDCRIVQ